MICNFRFLNTTFAEFYALAGVQFQMMMEIKEEYHDNCGTLDKIDSWQKDYFSTFRNHTYRYVPTAGVGMRTRLSEHLTFAAELAYQNQFAYDFHTGPVTAHRPDVYTFSTIGLNLQFGYRF